MARGDQGLTHVSIAWFPRASASTSGEIALAIQAASPDGNSYFSTGRTTSRQLSFDAPAGELVLKMKALDARGDEIESDSERITVPAFDGSKLAIGSPMVLRTRTAREARAPSRLGSDGQAEARREFDRTDRAVHSFPCLRRAGGRVAARLLNRRRQGTSALPVASSGRVSISSTFRSASASVTTM